MSKGFSSAIVFFDSTWDNLSSKINPSTGDQSVALIWEKHSKHALAIILRSNNESLSFSSVGFNRYLITVTGAGWSPGDLEEVDTRKK